MKGFIMEFVDLFFIFLNFDWLLILAFLIWGYCFGIGVPEINEDSNWILGIVGLIIIFSLVFTQSIMSLNSKDYSRLMRDNYLTKEVRDDLGNQRLTYRKVRNSYKEFGNGETMINKKSGPRY